MSQYNPRTLIRCIPNSLLQRTLAEYSAFDDLDWSDLGERDVEPIVQRLLLLNEDARRQISRQWRRVYALASNDGTAVLIETTQEKDPKIAAHLRDMKNGFERAYWCLLEHPEIFEDARITAHLRAFPQTSRETRVGFKTNANFAVDGTVEILRQRIRDRYSKELCGDMCDVEHRERAGIHYFYAYPSGYDDQIETYKTDGRRDWIDIKPPLEILYGLDNARGGVTILAKGGAAKREELLTIFAGCVLGESRLPDAPKKTYDLNVFKDPNNEFKTDPAHHIHSVRVIAIRLKFHDRPRNTAVYYADRHDQDDSIYDLLREKLVGGIGELKLSSILRVDLQVVFGEPGENELPVEFFISAPSSCSLGDSPRERLLQEYLRLWEIEQNGKRMEPVRAAARSKRPRFHL